MKASRRGPINWVRIVAVTVFACLSFLVVFVGSKQRLSRQASSGEVWRGFDGQRTEEWKGFKESNLLFFTAPPRPAFTLPPPLGPPHAPKVFGSFDVRSFLHPTMFPGCSHVEVLCNSSYEDHPRSDEFDLTIVIAGRNDEYGGVNGTGGSLERFQLSLRWMEFHLSRLQRRLSIEMIVVDWNPPEDRPPLSAVVFKPPSIASMRFITVPPAVHKALDHIYGPTRSYPDVLEFYAKNVAIRRSRSKWILPLALDTVLTGEWWDYLSEHSLGDPTEPILYRMFRVDLKVRMPRPKAHWQRMQETLLHNYVKATWGVAEGAFGGGGMSPSRDVREAGVVLTDAVGLNNTRDLLKRTTQACGDFQLMSRQNWFAFKGYWECPSYGHFDSIIMSMAYNRGVRGIPLMDPMFVLHPHHASGGFFKRKAQLGVPETDFGRFHRDRLQHNSNSCNWGYANVTFAELEWNFGKFARPKRQ